MKIKTELTWAIHNLVAHPLSEIFFWIGFIFPKARKLGDYIHDITLPRHNHGQGRG